MIQLYGMGSPNVLKIILMLEEVELPYDFHFVKIWTGEQFAPDFVAMNPNSKVPVIIDSDTAQGRPATVFESGAVLIYLAEKTGRLLPAGLERYQALQWLMIQLTGIGPSFGQYIHFSRFAPEGNDYGRNRFSSEALRLVSVLESRLADNAFLAGESYTIADISTYPWLNMLEAIGFPTADLPNLRRWRTSIAERPAAQRLHAKIAELAPLDKASRKSATSADLDRVFGRGAFQRG